MEQTWLIQEYSCKWIWWKTADLNIDSNNNPKSNINYTNKIINIQI